MEALDRRAVLGASVALALAGITGSSAATAAALSDLGAPQPFSWEALQQRAAALAARRYVPPVPDKRAQVIDFDAVGRLRYRPEASLAGGIRLFPLNRYANIPIGISIVEGGSARPLRFTPALFSAPRGTPPALGISGFRAMTPGRDSDWLAFQGASYFRSSGSQDQYGLSARGLAIDTGIEGKEEFPLFTDFWIEAKSPRDYIVYALLDGESVTGAYRFDCVLGADGVTQAVSASLHFRRDIERLGIAPMSSMFWYGEGNRAAAVDWRPEIHDSDGLAMFTGAGERLWRPLVNPERPTLDSFLDQNPKGFGLIQRDRAFADYQDDGAFYNRRPNLWVEPGSGWGKGAVMLYAFPTNGEITDNIVAFWSPAAPARAGGALALDYRLDWTSQDPSVDGVAHALDRFSGVAGRPGQPPIPGARKLVVDFAGKPLAGLTRQSGVEAVIDVSGGRLIEKSAYPIVGEADRWRVMADVALGHGDPVTARIYLRRGGTALSETVLAPVT